MKGAKSQCFPPTLFNSSQQHGRLNTEFKTMGWIDLNQKLDIENLCYEGRGIEGGK